MAAPASLCLSGPKKLQNEDSVIDISTAAGLTPAALPGNLLNRDDSWKPRVIPKWVLWLACALCLGTGLGTIFVSKWQNRHHLAPCDGCTPVFYEQPYWQTLVMFLAETLCLGLHGIDMLLKRKKDAKLGAFEFPAHSYSLDRLSVPWWWFAGPSLMDLIGTSLVNFAFAMTYASTVQMLRNSLVLFTATMSMLIMRKPLRVFEWIGITIMTAGMLLSGIDAILRPETSTNTDPTKSYLGVLFTLLGTVLNAGTIISEEWMLKARYCPPLRAVGYCGVTGLLWNLAALPIVHIFAVENLNHNWYMLFHSHSLMLSQFVYMAASSTFNATGMIVTKVGTGLLKGMLYACRAPLMWLIELFLGWQGFSLLNMAGLILTFFGFFVFANAIPRVPRLARLNRAYDKEITCFCTRPTPSEAEEAT